MKATTKTMQDHNTRKETKIMATNKTNKTIKNEKETKIMSNKIEYKLTKTSLLNKINRAIYQEPSDITGECAVIIHDYETGVGLRHTNNTYVYSIRQDNPEVNDVQPSDEVFGYIKMFIEIIKDNKQQYTTVTVNQGFFDRLATGLMNTLYPSDDLISATLQELLSKAVSDKTPISVNRVLYKGNYVIYWTRYTHQPRYKIPYTLNTAQNVALFKEAFETNKYYSSLKYNTHYVVTISDFFLKYKNEDIVRLGLRLVADIIDTENAYCIGNTVLSIANAYGKEGFEDLEAFMEEIKSKKFIFMSQLDTSSKNKNQYEVYVFGKEVK